MNDQQTIYTTQRFHDVFGDPSFDSIAEREFRDDIRLTLASLMSRSAGERIMVGYLHPDINAAIQALYGDATYYRASNDNFAPDPVFVRRYFKEKGMSETAISKMLKRFKDQLKYLLKDVEEAGYRSLNSWRIEIAGMLIILHSGSKSKCRKVLQKIKDFFGEKIYENALAFARRNSYDGAKNWFNDITVVDSICARARVQTASVYKLAVA